MTPQVPQHIKIEMARRELKLLMKQKGMAIGAIDQLTTALKVLDSDAALVIPSVSQPLRFAVSALISVRLLELQDHHHNLSERIPELENALKIADGGIVIPGMRVKS